MVLVRRVLLVGLVLTSCAAISASPKGADAARLQKIKAQDWSVSCSRYGKLRRSKSQGLEFELLRDYLVGEDLLTGIDLESVADHRIRVGMTQCGVVGVLGLPVRINRHTSRYGAKDQLVYAAGAIRYVYTEERIGFKTQVVTSISSVN